MEKEEIIPNKQGNNIGCLVFIILIIVIIIISIFNNNGKYTYTNEGITISTNDYLEKSNKLGKIIFLQNKNIGLEIYGEKHTFESLEKYGINQNSTIEDYLKYDIKKNNYAAKIETHEDIIYYTHSLNKYLFVTAKKTNKAFYLFVFSAPKNSAQLFKEDFIEYAKNIKINDN